MLVVPVNVSNRSENALYGNESVDFWYNGKLRWGRVEKLAAEYMTIEVGHDINSDCHDSGEFKSFRFDRMESSIRVRCQATDSNGCSLPSFN